MEILHPKICIALIVCISLIPISVDAVNFGSLVKNNNVKTQGGETVKVSILLWTTDEEHNVKFNVKDAPENWNVIITPTEFVLNKNPEEPIEIISISNEYIKAKVVTVYVIIPEETRGIHKVIINAILGFGENQIQIQQERQFILNIETGEAPELENETIMDEISPPKEGKKESSGPNIFSYIMIILILISAWLIYKHE